MARESMGPRVRRPVRSERQSVPRTLARRQHGAGPAPSITQESLAQVQRQLQQLQLHQLELQMQNEELQRAQRELALARDRYALLFDLAPVGCLLVDGEDRIVEVNPAAGALQHRTLEDLRGPRADLMFTPRHRPLWHALLTAARAGAPARAELELDDGAHGDASCVQADAAFDAATATTLVTLLDVSQRRRAGALQDAAVQASERSSAQKSRFLSSLSHELRTPLNAVLGFSQLLLGGNEHPLDESQRARVEHIQRAGRQLLTLVQESTDIARIESGRLGIALAAVPVHEFFAECVPMFEPDAQQAGVRLQVLAGPGPGDWVLADPDRLRQVLINLLSNAVKYNRRGGSVTLACRRDAAAGTLDLVVTDTGLGMTADQQARLFRPFDRLGAERTAVQGTGLGLTITRLLVEAMGGTLCIESRPGQGSVVSVTLSQAPPPTV